MKWWADERLLMLIDPFTIIAQIVNFVVLVVALKYLLYNRVLDAMDAREQAIADRLHEAEEREAQADQARQGHQDQIDDFARRRGELLDEARVDADDRHREMLESARRDIDDQRRRWQSALRREHRDLERDLRTRTADAALSLSRHVLADLADADLERRSVVLALDRLATGNDLTDFLSTDDRSPITVRTAFGDDQIKELVGDRLTAHGLNDRGRLSFETDPTLLLGIEFASTTESIEWHAADYLEQLDSVVGDLLDEFDFGDDTRDEADDLRSVAEGAHVDAR